MFHILKRSHGIRIILMQTTRSMTCRNFCKELTKSDAMKGVCLLEDQIAIVRSTNDDSKLSISFELDGKKRNLQRKKEEPLGNTLKRIYLNAVAQPSKKQKKQKSSKDSKKVRTSGSDSAASEDKVPSDDFKVEIIAESTSSDGPLSEETVNSNAWKSGHILLIGNQKYQIDVNPPSVLSLELPDSMMSGFPVIPLVTLEFATRSDSKFLWYKRNLNSVKEESPMENKMNCCEENSKWTFIKEGFTYVPSNDDLGSKLKVICIPANLKRSGNFPKEAVSSVSVSAGPGLCPFDNRHIYTMKQTNGNKSFRVISYNILADTYASGEFARKVLYPYCMDYVLDIGYRRQLLLKEIIGYNADILCLQECDSKVFDCYLTHALEVEGFVGLFCQKAGEVPEGEALFFRKKLFTLVSQHDIPFTKALELECNNAIAKKLKGSEALLEKFMNRGQVGQIAVLRDLRDETRLICVVNTHLYFKPTAGHIRLLQIAVLLNYIHTVVTSLKTVSSCNSSEEPWECENPGKASKVALLLCGDLNSSPNRPVIEFLLNGHLDANHSVWKTDEPQESGLCLELSHSMKLFSACGFPEFTNFVNGFEATLDYIFADSEEFDVESIIPLPSREEVELYTALPSVVVPSDHLAIVCDLCWK